MMYRHFPFCRGLVAGTAIAVTGFFCTEIYASENKRDAFMKPFTSLSAEQKFNHSLGRSLFEKFWVAAPSSTTASDGLGPLYNARSCHSCHLNNGKGHAPAALQNATNVPSFFLRLKQWPQSKHADSKKAVEPDPIYGTQLQSNSNINIPAEMKMNIQYEYYTVTFLDGSTSELRKPNYLFERFFYGKPHENTQYSGRVSPALIGVGLFDAVDDTTLLKFADPDDKDNDGISGKANIVWDETKKTWRPGRFGWKATVATLTQQNQSAFNGDLGLSTPLFSNPNGDCTIAQHQCLELQNGNSPHMDNLEVSHVVTDMVDTFTALSAPPKMRNLANEKFIQGKVIFDNLQCAACHKPVMKTGVHTTFSELNNKTFYPFSDLLLHDMGEGLADVGNEFDAKGSEWRTAPLWGLGLNKIVSKRESYLHDGRARSLNEAILWHGGEAQASQNSYRQLNITQRSTLIKFLESL